MSDNTKHVCPMGGYCEICEAGVGEGVTPPQVPETCVACSSVLEVGPYQLWCSKPGCSAQFQPIRRKVTPPSPEPPTDTAIRLLRRYFANESESRGGYDELTSETADFLERLDGVSQGQAEPPSQPTDCPKHGGINQYCSVCLAELAEKVAIGARVSPTAAIDALELAKQVLDGLDSYCGANDAGEPYEGEDCPHEYIGLDLMQKTRNALTAALKQGGTQS
jgi:hypothetical protein